MFDLKFLYSVPYIIWLLFSVIFFGWGEYLSKKFTLTPTWNYVLGVEIVYAIGVLFWLPALLQKNQLSVLGTMWSLLSLITTVVIGLVIFGERLNMFGIVGIVMAFIFIIILSFA
jgi:multidrug transporter EmrE-like cation transporter